MSGYNDLMVEIFERLPSKSIIRFRSLSKYWHSRLVTPEFIRKHRLRCSKNPPKLLTRRGFLRRSRVQRHLCITPGRPVAVAYSRIQVSQHTEG
ncbi:putative F-box domain, leucine-rich repeat domain superfamily, F-box-like domain superfamily [Helianthus anomalus]